MELPILEEDLAVKLRRSQRRNQATRLQVSKIGCCLRKRRSRKKSTSAGNSTSAGVFNGEGATEAHHQINAHQSRYPLTLPRPRSNFPLLPKRGSLQRGRARAGRAHQIKAEGGCKTWTTSPSSTTGRRCGPQCHPQRARCQR